ncbi:DNA cytosine methyltransferase [Parablautia intestinalis]|uniref:DNA (cytosine-5-)-methyltransferase n=1 Tax=Parablautia intestinalis TaxID=2320100 RepID=A0A3A9B3J0_9FIRM|nr:DNA cytosine methyltransferase [Parablautia intestinalis]RKI94313.1 DNA cytosine methyltransferase [Parablautia intestinalis]
MINGELIVDNFAGGGGASTGIELATGCSVDIAVNHDPEAVRMHKTNHPSTRHYCESVWDVDPVEACKGHPVALAWFSPDCKHFSKAKGGKPKDKNIRGLAWVALRWAGRVRPRVIMLENVEEFKTWGPLNRSHRPIKAKQGVTYKKFIVQLENLGYTVESREISAADYGAPTIRKRFFLIARCDGKSIVWPEPTHGPAGSPEVEAGIKKPYAGACTQIDFSLPCPSIFDTAKEIKEKYGIRAVRPLAPKTMERIARGLKKFVLDNAEPFIIQVNHSGSSHDYCSSMNEPLRAVTSKHGFGIVEPFIVQIGQTGFAGDRSKDMQVTEPILTVDSSNRYGLVASFLHKYYDGGYKGDGSSLEAPLHTVTARDHNSLYAAALIQMNNHCDGKNIKQPLPTITAGDGHFGEVRAFLIKYYGQGTGQDIKQPLDTIPTHDRFGLVTIAGVDYQIADIGLRMLEPRELYGCQGFPEDYIIDHDYTGKHYPRAEQVKRCGNAVCPPISAALVRANLPEICVADRAPNMRITEGDNGQLKFA